MDDYVIAIVLAAGQGKRMNSKTKKQFMMLNNKPIVTYSLELFQKSKLINEIILVTNEDEIEYCEKEIVEKHSIDKISKIVKGGAERFNSVYNALNNIDKKNCYVLIHDGARPFISNELIEKCVKKVKEVKACIVGVKVKDTIKEINNQGYVEKKLEREKLIAVQTPQVFEYKLISSAYNYYVSNNLDGATDDAEILEEYNRYNITVIEGDYKNIKITTPEDLIFGEVLVREK